MNLGLSGKVAIVTGGTKGIGRAIVDELLAEGAAVAFCARNADEVAAVTQELGGEGQPIYGAVADVTDTAAIGVFVDDAVAALGTVDILVNNAGRAHPGGFDTLTDADWQADVDVKLYSMVRCTRAVLPYMRSRGAGRVININAVYGKGPDPAFFATSVVRAACLSLTKTLSIELAPEGILVNSVNIGYVQTPQWDNVHALRAPEVDREEFFARSAHAVVPMDRFGRPDEVSGLVVFLAGQRSSYITGASIDVAGGMGNYL